MSGERRADSGTTPGDKGRFDGYDVMAQERHWDATTAEVVKKRLAPPEDKLRFFSEAEARTAGALFDGILAQRSEPRVPVLQMVDARLAAGDTDGWHYEDMPEDNVAWHESLIYLEADAQEVFARPFWECSHVERGEIIQAVQSSETWHGLPSPHIWSLWSRYACAAFYSHPWAWNEIGFSGPAYPRGYKVLRLGWREPWEVAERRPASPVPWANRVEQAKEAHKARVGHSSEAGR